MDDWENSKEATWIPGEPVCKKQVTGSKVLQNQRHINRLFEQDKFFHKDCCSFNGLALSRGVYAFTTPGTNKETGEICTSVEQKLKG